MNTLNFNTAFKQVGDEIKPSAAANTVIEKTMRVILDTNTWLDWLLFNDDCTKSLKSLQYQGVIEILATHEMRSELHEVLGRPHIGARFIARSEFDSVAELMAEFDRLAILMQAPAANKLVPQCKDGDDQIFIDAAVASKAILITKDRLVLGLARQLKQRFDTLVIKPHSAAEWIQDQHAQLANSN